MIEERFKSEFLKALIVAVLLASAGPAAFAGCPKPQRSVGWIVSTTGSSASVERSGKLYTVEPGDAICTSDRVIALEEPVTIHMKCEGERTLTPRHDLQIGTKTWYTNLCVREKWSALFASEKRDATARAVTLSPQPFAFAIAGLEEGSARLEKVPKSLRVPVDSLMLLPVSARLVDPGGKVYEAQTRDTGPQITLIFKGIKSVAGEWAIEVSNGNDILFGSFSVGPGGISIDRKRTPDDVLSEACGDAAAHSLGAYNSAGPQDEPMLREMLNFWSSPDSDSLCAIG